MSAPGTTASTQVSMRSLTVSCLVEDDRPKIRWYHGIPTEPSSSWTMIVVGVSSVGTLSGVVVGFSSLASSAPPDCWAPDWTSTDEAGAPAPDWLSSCGLAAKAAGVVTAVMARVSAVSSTNAEVLRWDIYGSLV